ncbi:EAL domain-containing protein [Streptomyces sp. ODS28]|uniref:putative bifunctional diguanylate cyclase/phosphodiesterase n=1 Tax=Streptomyces sp. ODS28 TaxID=3136688 RepID=UPI0031EF3B1B
MSVHGAVPEQGRYRTRTLPHGPRPAARDTRGPGETRELLAPFGTVDAPGAEPEPGPAARRRPGRSKGGGRRGRPALVPQLTLVVLCGGYAVGAAVGWGSRQVALFMGDFGLAIAGLLAAASCLWFARARCRPGSRSRSGARPAWVLFGISSLMAAAGNAIWGWYELVLNEPLPRPSAADFCFLLFAPPAIIGLLVLAKRPVTRAGWVCLSLDAWLIAGSLLTLSWSLALAHTAYGQGESVAGAALDLAYPLLDIVLVSMVLALHFRRSSAHRTAVNTAIGGLALTVLCDALFTSPLMQQHYSSGQFLDAGWFAGSLLLAYAPWAASREAGRRDSARRADGSLRYAASAASHDAVLRAGDPSPAAAPRPGSGHPALPGRPIAGSLAALTPYLAAAVCTLGILYNSLDGRDIDRMVLFTGCTVVLALVVRQGIMLLDNVTLTQELAQKENHFRSLVQGSSDVIMIASSTGVLRYVSPAAAGVYGRDGDALVGSELASLIHPEDLGRVLHELRRFLAAAPESESSTRIECRVRHGAGHWLNVESTVNRYQGGLIFNSRDVTERVRLQAQLQHNASHDALTDLPNRSLFTERVRKALSGRRGGDSEAAVLYIDLDGFKAVNDTVGHQAGDELLVHAARRLQESVRAGDTAARLGGDEFAVLILGDSDPSKHAHAERELRIHEIADRLRVTLSEPYKVEGDTEVRVAASIGIAFAEPGISPSALMRNADLAMYRAKQAGKGRVELYAPQMQAEVVKRTELATRLRSALHDGEFALLHQPVVELASGKVTAVAAQPRWRSQQGILFTPAEFLRTEGAEGGPADRAQGDKAAEVSRWLLEEATAQAAARHRAGHPVPVIVRFPARRLTDRSLSLSSVEAMLRSHDLPPGALILELSDSDPRIPLDELEMRLAALRKMGVCLALDGFGSGYLALSALRKLPVDILRLDRGLVDGLAESPRQRKITSGLLRIAGDLGLTSVADGVDLPEQVSALRELGCTHGQGAVFSGALDEHRLRHALNRGIYPVPEEHKGRSVVVAGALPVRHKEGRETLPPWVAAGDGGEVPDPATVGEPAGIPPMRSNTETPVPPT